MGDSYGDPQKGQSLDRARDAGRGGFKGGRGNNNREGGGFRIRLSDNEMRASRSIQEAFNLRSTVAVLGFALRTLGQMLEEGKLEDLKAQHFSQAPRGNNNRSQSFREGRKNNDDFQSRSKPNPFARPAKPQSQPSKTIEEEEEEKKENKDGSINNVDAEETKSLTTSQDNPDFASSQSNEVTSEEEENKSLTSQE